MKTVVSISLGPADLDYDLETEFLGQRLRVIRVGTDGSVSQAESAIREWEPKADVIGLGMVQDHYLVGTRRITHRDTLRLENAVQSVPVTTGATLRGILQDWAVRHAQLELEHCFNNARVLFLNGQANYRPARVFSEYTDNLFFADPVKQMGIPKLLTSLEGLELYAAGTGPVHEYALTGTLTKLPGSRNINRYVMRKAAANADVIAARYDELQDFGLEELGGKTVLTASISDERLKDLGDRGVNTVIDYTPQLFNETVGVNVVQAMIIAALERSPSEITHDDYLDIITNLGIEPRILYPSGYKRISRFAFVIHPLSQQYFRKSKPLDMVAEYAPPMFMNTVEKVMAYSPPFVYSRVSGIKSPTGAEAEGWLITVGGTPKEIMAHSPEFTYRRLLSAARLAKRMGAQIMGLGAFTKVVGDAGLTVSKRAPLPITTGNSYSASGALWAANVALKKLGLVEIGDSGKAKAKVMVVGATGAIGSVCARLLAKAVDEVYLVARESAKLLALKESILKETPHATVHVTSNPNKYLGEMDMVVTATSGAGKKILDIMQVKPGCVITDVARPLDIPASDVAKRPDVLVIESGEVELPGDNVQMKNIGLPPKVAYACLAETIVLALEGRYENFTVGREIEWEKVREIYKLGLKHGMKLASISGVNGVYTEEDFDRVRTLAMEARGISPADKPKSKAAPRKKATKAATT
ncbi:MAG: dehydrogenase [Oleiphilaceae bacterium]|nr:dehydrogenase [Oleiphilaceae bacterium]